MDRNYLIIIIGLLVIIFMSLFSILSRFFMFKFIKDILEEIKKFKAYYQ